jgi:hypothetical protein
LRGGKLDGQLLGRKEADERGELFLKMFYNLNFKVMIQTPIALPPDP